MIHVPNRVSYLHGTNICRPQDICSDSVSTYVWIFVHVVGCTYVVGKLKGILLVESEAFILFSDLEDVLIGIGCGKW